MYVFKKKNISNKYLSGENSGLLYNAVIIDNSINQIIYLLVQKRNMQNTPNTNLLHF